MRPEKTTPRSGQAAGGRGQSKAGGLDGHSSIAVTRLKNAQGTLTKTFYLDDAGALQKHTAAYLKTGTAETIRCADLYEFAKLLTSLDSSQALAYGVTGRDKADVVTQKMLPQHPDAIARDAEHFAFARGPGIWMLDHDADHLAEAFTDEGLRNALLDACPELREAPMVTWPSASSCVVNSETGEELRGLRGQRVYIPVVDATDIPRAGKVLYELLWAAGYGRFVVSKSGRLLDRNIVDAAVWQPERLDFAAGAHCHPPLVQRRPEPRIWEAELVGGLDPFDTRMIPDVTPEVAERAAWNRAEARRAVEAEALEVRKTFAAEKAKELANARGLTLDRASDVIDNALGRALLFPDFVLYPAEGEPTTVGEVLDNPSRWHGARFADPLEPDYRDDRRIAWVNLHSGGRPYLFSHAHGGQRYELIRQPRRLRVQAGELPRLADEALELIKLNGGMFDFGHRDMVRVADGRIHHVGPTYLYDYLGRIAQFVRFDKRTKCDVIIDTPDKLPKIILDRTGERGLPKLHALITAPTMRADGTIFDEPGYDAATGLFYQTDEVAPARVPTAPDRKAVEAALSTLWAPFAEFPYADAESRGVMLAALLTAIVRRSLPTAPGFAFDAPAAGSGKSLLARCVSLLGGNDGSSFAPPAADDEVRKMLFAALREGSGCVILDNLVEPLGGAAVNQFLTEPVYASRILGVSENEAVPNAAMFLVTGNNLAFVGDTCRRILPCRIDPKMEVPYLRRFEFDPADWVKRRRQALVVAGLTLLRAYQQAGAPVMGKGALASFEAWDALVRQAVCWLAAEQSELELADPAKVLSRNEQADSAKETLADVLAAIYGVFGERAFKTRELIDVQGLSDEEMALHKAIRAVAAQRGGEFNDKRLGWWLRKHRDVVAGGRRIAQIPSEKSGSLWRVVC